MRRFVASLFEVLEVAIVAVGAVVLIRAFLVQPFLVSGASMVPTFEDGDYLLVDELTYRLRSPQRGEVAVFHYPNDESTYFIKRVVGLPGEHVSIEDGKVVITNAEHTEGFVLDESYLAFGSMTEGEADVDLGGDQYFVLGDNRPYSFDSRSWGALTADELVGVVRLRLWPLKMVKVFAAPEYAY